VAGGEGEGPLSASRVFWPAFALLLLTHAAALTALAAITPWTTDEPNYLQAGRALADGFDFAPYSTILHGPIPFLANQLAAPLAPADALIDDYPYKFWGRLGLLPLSLLAAFALGWWTRAAFGPRLALAATALYTLNPIVLGHGCLMTADVALTAFYLLAGFAAWRWLTAPSLPRLVAVGAAVGASLATKYLGLFLIPALGLASLWSCARGVRPALLWSRRADAGLGRRIADLLPAAALCAVAAALVLHTCYLWRVPGYFPRPQAASGAPIDPQSADASPLSATLRSALQVPGVAPALALLPDPWVRGVDYQLYIAKAGVTHFGDRIGTGFAAYFVVALGVKLPLAFLALLVLGLLARAPRAPPQLIPVVACSVAVPLVYLSLFTTLQIGVRYLLPIVPLLCMVAARAFTWRWLPAALLAVHVLATALAWPRYVQWFNPLASERPYLLFADSNVDWRAGQHDDRDREAVARAHPDASELFPLSGPQLGKVFAYALDLSRPDPRDHWRIHHWLRRFHPVDRVGAWFVFDIDETEFRAAVGGDARGRAELAVALLGAGRTDDALALVEGNPDPDAAKIARAAALPRGAERALLLAELGRFDLVLADAGSLPKYQVAYAHFCQGQAATSAELLRALESERALNLAEAALLASALRESGEPEQALAVLERYEPAPGDRFHADWVRIMERHRQQTAAMRLVERKGQRR
jgi:4-amino-4-deoxy-L-arabinose transferase-like glycosyltransferase